MEIEHDLLEEHRIAAIQLKEWKAKELELRNQITDVLLEGLDTGTHNFTMHGMFVKAVKGVSYSIDKSVLDVIWDDMDPDERELVRWKPELNLKDYKNNSLPLVLDDAITVKPSLPTLSITLGS